MSAPSKYLQRKFTDAFRDGCEFWTSEDGTLMSLCILRTGDWAWRLQKGYAHIFAKEPFDARQAKEKFVTQESKGSEWFDGPGCGKKRGKVWAVTEEKTPFEIIEYELKLPR